MKWLACFCANQAVLVLESYKSELYIYLHTFAHVFPFTLFLLLCVCVCDFSPFFAMGFTICLLICSVTYLSLFFLPFFSFLLVTLKWHLLLVISPNKVCVYYGAVCIGVVGAGGGGVSNTDYHQYPYSSPSSLVFILARLRL